MAELLARQPGVHDRGYLLGPGQSMGQPALTTTTVLRFAAATRSTSSFGAPAGSRSCGRVPRSPRSRRCRRPRWPRRPRPRRQRPMSSGRRSRAPRSPRSAGWARCVGVGLRRDEDALAGLEVEGPAGLGAFEEGGRDVDSGRGVPLVGGPNAIDEEAPSTEPADGYAVWAARPGVSQAESRTAKSSCGRSAGRSPKRCKSLEGTLYRATGEPAAPGRGRTRSSGPGRRPGPSGPSESVVAGSGRCHILARELSQPRRAAPPSAPRGEWRRRERRYVRRRRPACRAGPHWGR